MDVKQEVRLDVGLCIKMERNHRRKYSIAYAQFMAATWVGNEKFTM